MSTIIGKSPFGYYECNNYGDDILIARKYSLTDCSIEGTALNGGIAGEYKGTYTNDVTIDLDHYSLDTVNLDTGTSAGGLFGKYTASGNVTITDTDTTDDFAPPHSAVAYGGVIGEYVNSSYAKTLSLTDFTIDGLTCTSSGNVGGVIRQLTGAVYVSVSRVCITDVNAGSASYFGGIAATLNNNNNAGSFIDVTGDFTLSTASGKSYKGGAIAGSFKKGVIRFAGVTDISGAKAANGYAQLVYENDETLVYALGNGEDSNWTLKRNADTTASDLGQWGEVVRMFTVNGVEKNAEGAGLVSVANHKVTVAQGVTALTDTVSFAKCALNMQLNDGSDHGALCFADKTTYRKSVLLNSAVTVSGEIDLSGTGLLGLMRDGGNGKYVKTDNNSFAGSPDFFQGSISGATGASTDKILLAVGESYGCDANGNALSAGSTGGRIYLSNNWGHDAQGLISFGKGASFSSITVGGTMHVSRADGSNHLYMAPLIGAMTNGASLTNVTVNTNLTADRADNAKFYIGGVSGVFDGNETTANPYSLSISGSTITPEIALTGSVSGANPSEDETIKTYEQNNTYAGGVLGLLKGANSTQYNVSVTSKFMIMRIPPARGITGNGFLIMSAHRNLILRAISII